MKAFYRIALFLSIVAVMINPKDLLFNIRTLIHHKLWPPYLRNEIIQIIEKDMQKRNDGTSLIGTFVRLAWHASGTYSAEDDSGGSNGGRVRLPGPHGQKDWGANAGLDVAMDALDPIIEDNKKSSIFTSSSLSYADLYTFAGVVSVEYAGGPKIEYNFGRIDDCTSSLEEELEKSSSNNKSNIAIPDDRLPDADKGTQKKTADHMRQIFHRMGFSTQEMVCLTGAHTLGRCHMDRSGYWGPWNKAENKFNNALFTFLLQMKWTVKKTHEGGKWKGPKQYENPSGELMMLPSCMAMIQDEEMREYVELYSNDQELFFKDFSKAFSKLLALGTENDNKSGLFC